MGELVMVSQSRLTLCDPVDCSPPGSPVHGILQARMLEWVALFQGIFLTWGWNPHHRHLLHYRQIFYPLSHLGSPCLIYSKWLVKFLFLYEY